MLTGSGAHRLDQSLGLGRLLRAGQVLGTATVSPSLASLLNQTFAESRRLPPVFAAGEPLGQIAFMAGTHGR